MTLDEYREQHPRDQCVPRSEYDVTSYQAWRREVLEWCQYGSGTVGHVVQRLVEVLAEDPRG